MSNRSEFSRRAIRGPVAGPPSVARVTGAVARLVHRHSLAADVLACFGLPADVLADRVHVLAGAPHGERIRAASRVRELAAALCATCEVIEGVDDTAASAAVDLAAIVAECDLIASADEFAVEDAPEDSADTIADAA